MTADRGRQAVWMPAVIADRIKRLAEVKSAEQGGRPVFYGEIVADAVKCLEQRQRQGRPERVAGDD